MLFPFQGCYNIEIKFFNCPYISGKLPNLS
nr:MAG TPA: hypothetical protein [Caudoviricetes sp.]